MPLFGFGAHMRDNGYKGALFPWSDAVVRFAPEVGVENIVARTRYLPVLNHMAVLRSSESD